MPGLALLAVIPCLMLKQSLGVVSGIDQPIFAIEKFAIPVLYSYLLYRSN
jgi:hypothetical protein